MDEAQDYLLSEIDLATQHLLRTVSLLTEDELRRPSLLAGWTRSHVLAHVAQSGEAIGNMLRGVRTGQPAAAYGSQDARDQAIEEGAKQGARALLAELTASAERFRSEVRAMPEHLWQQGVHVLGGAEFPAAGLLERRLVEVVLHHTDLGAGYRSENWPTRFIELDLPEPMRTQRHDREAAPTPGLGAPVRLLLVSGSTRSGSTNTAVLRTAEKLTSEEVTTVLYGGLANLPAFNPDDDHEPLHTAVADLRRQVDAADAVLFCTPEYAGALPGSFKNLLDWTVGGGEIYGKPVAWINVSSVAAPTGGADAHASLAKVLGYVGADIVEEACVRAPMSRAAVGPAGTVTDPQVRQQLAEVMESLTRYVGDSSRGAH